MSVVEFGFMFSVVGVMIIKDLCSRDIAFYGDRVSDFQDKCFESSTVILSKFDRSRILRFVCLFVCLFCLFA